MGVQKKRSSKPYRVKDKAQPPSERRVLIGRIAWLSLGALWLFVVVSLVSFNVSDAPSHAVYPHNASTSNLGGPVGAHLSYALLRFIGLGVLIPVLFTGTLIGLRLFGRSMSQPLVRASGAAVLTCALSALLGVLAPNLIALPGLGGGTVGLVGAAELLPRFAMLGTLVWIGALTIIGLLVCCDRYLWEVPMMLWTRLAPTLARTSERAGGAAEVAAARANAATGRAAQGTKVAGGGVLGALRAWMDRRKKPVMVRANDIDPDMVELKPTPEVQAQAQAPRVKPKHVVKPVPAPVQEIEDDEDEADGAPQVFDRDKLREKIEALPVRFAQDNKTLATDEDLADFQDVQSLEGYKFPVLDLLVEPEIGFNEKLEELVREQAEALEHSLMQYKIDGEVVDIESGPAITLYHIRLAPGTKVAQINAIESDLARSLKAVNIRVVSNMEGRDTIGIEVPNPTKERVRLKELMSNRDLFSKMKLPMFLGKDAAGDPLISDLTKMPHMLIAGTTGSGKSVCMNTIIMSFLYTKRPDELKLVLVDPKMVEMSQFKDIPHLMCPVVTEMPKAAAILEWAVTKMDERYELLAEAGCRDISSYNDLDIEELKERLDIEHEEQLARVPKKLPYMVFIIDELADLMMTNKEVEGAIIRIAQKARAVGIHLILATQRPQANVVTGLIKSNMPCRIAFKVASGMDSRIVLDQKGGELLLGQGDMLHLSPSSHKLSRAQGTLVDDAEIRKVVRFLKDIAAPSFERSLMQVKGEQGSDEERMLQSQNNSSASLAAAQEDPMFDRAVEIVLETKRGSVSLLQRRLAIGYTRASRLIDLMGIAGIISDHKGSVARDVMITIDEWDMMKEMAQEMEREQQLGGSGSDPEDPHQTSMFDGEVEEETESQHHDEHEDQVSDEDQDPSAGVVVSDDIDNVPFEADNDAGVIVHAQSDEPEVEMLLDDAEALVDELAEDAAAEDEDELEDEEDAEYVSEEEEDEESQEDDEEYEEVAEEDEDEEELEEDEEPVAEEEEDDEDEETEEDAEEVEYEYVDEDGNPIDPSELEEDDIEYVEVVDEEEDEEEDEDDEELEYEEEDAAEEDEHAHA